MEEINFTVSSKSRYVIYFAAKIKILKKYRKLEGMSTEWRIKAEKGIHNIWQRYHIYMPTWLSIISYRWWQVRPKSKMAKFYLCLTKYHAVKTYRGSGSVDQHILKVDTTEMSGTLQAPGALPPSPRVRTSSTHWISSWVSPRAGLGEGTLKSRQDG
jgi:hypothetical protein